MLHKVLLATDGSEPAQRAARLCLDVKRRLPEIEVGVITVAPALGGAYGTDPGLLDIPMSEAYQEEAERVAGERRLHAVQPFRDAGISVIEEHATGDAAIEIARVASEHGYDHIIIGSHGHGMVGSLFLGSVARKVLHLAHCPVTVVKR